MICTVTISDDSLGHILQLAISMLEQSRIHGWKRMGREDTIRIPVHRHRCTDGVDSLVGRKQPLISQRKLRKQTNPKIARVLGSKH